MSETNQLHVSKDDQPSIPGEYLVAQIRLGLTALLFFFTAAYALVIPGVQPSMLYGFWLFFTLWSASSVAVFQLIKRELFKPWMSYGTLVLDILFVTVLQLQAVAIFELNFIGNLTPSLFLLIVALSAIRRCVRLVVIAGFLSAFVFLILSGVLFFLFLPAEHIYVRHNGQIFYGISFLDHIIKALCMLVFGWLLGYIAKRTHKSRQHYQTLFEHIPDGILITNLNGRIDTVNKNFVKMTGLTEDQIIGNDYQKFLGHRDAVEASVDVLNSMAVGNPTTLFHRDGTVIPVLTTAVQIEKKSGRKIIFSVRDITTQANLERQLVRSQKMETIGKLAGGLTHDFSNLLGGILGAASLAALTIAKLPRNQRIKLNKQITIVQECGENARNAVKKLLIFSRSSSIEKEEINLSEVCKETIALCRDTFGSNYLFNADIKIMKALVNANSSAVTQSILNLCINAKDAMPQGGVIIARLSSVTSDRSFLRKHPDATPAIIYWKIEIEDSGDGMDPETQKMIFDPFFSTRSSEQKSGLGLSMVHSIMQQHNGFVDFKSRPKEGTSFALYFPRFSKPTPLAGAGSEAVR